jgi:thiol-disulfide isomerase/thioredoxin
MYTYCILLILLILKLPAQPVFLSEKWQFTDGRKVALTSSHEYTVWVFLAPECPLCISYSKTLNALNGKYANERIRFVGVFTGTHDTQEEIANYMQNFKITFPCVTDPNGKIARHYKAGITPEVCVVNRRDVTLYRGRIDNWAYSLGKKRSVITKHDLKDVLEKCAGDISFKPYTTQAIGCIIE